jgi:isoleucyl-tRNA synthetase
MAPIISFTSEEVWKYLPSQRRKSLSVHLMSFPEVKKEYMDEDLNSRWEKIWEIRSVVTKALEEARKQKLIGLSLDAQVHLYLPEKIYQFILPYETELKSIFIVSSVAIHPTKEDKIRAEVFHAEGNKCERCWNYDLSVGQNLEHPKICSRCIEVIKE